MTKRNTYTHLSQSDITIQIERLVQGIERHDTPAFRFRQARVGFDRIEPTRLSKYFDHIQQMVDLYDDRYEYRYSEHLQAFWEAFQDIRLERSPGGPVCLNEEGTAYLDYHRSMNVLAAQIRHLRRTRDYRPNANDLRYQAKQQAVRVIKYVDGVINRYARTVVVRIDLYYRQEAQARLRVEQVFDDLDRLIAERERNPLFDHETGYICSVEQGDDRGYHIHAAFFFNGAEVRKDVYKAQQLGELWERITRGQGCFNSCNHDKEQYGERCALGVVRRDDLNARRHVHYAMRYLVKDDQQLRLRPSRAKGVRIGLLNRLSAG